jgi:hypothetical protein
MGKALFLSAFSSSIEDERKTAIFKRRATMKPVIKAVLCQVFLFFLLVPAAWCDEIEDAVQEGIQYYRDGDNGLFFLLTTT